MINKKYLLYSLLLISFLLSACASTPKGYKGTTYPPTEQIEAIFQMSQSPASCRVIANMFATMPAKMTTGAFSEKISAEAKSKGADLMLIGQSRQSETESSLSYSYYGLDREYNVNEWPGWSFGLDDWAEQGNWETIGYDEWMQKDVHFDYPIVMQMVFIRCQQ